MKILYISHRSVIDGSGTALLNILKNLPQHITPLVIIPKKGPLTETFEKLNIPYEVIRMIDDSHPFVTSIKDIFLYIPRCLRIFFINNLALIKLRRIVNGFKPDLIHTNTGVLNIGHFLGLKFHIPHIWHIREYQEKTFNIAPYRGIHWKKKLFNNNNNHCIAITPDVFNFFALNHSKDFVVFDGIFQTESKPSIKENKQKYFLFAGTIQPGKGIFDILDAFEKFSSKNENFELWLAGRDLININEIIAKVVCKPKIKYLGFRQDVYSLMQNATALIVASKTEGFGFITAEAMFNGCLVIGRNNTGTKVQFDQGLLDTGHEIGIRYSTKDELVEKMLYVANTPNKTFSSLLYEAQNVASKYTTQRNVNEIFTIYNMYTK